MTQPYPSSPNDPGQKPLPPTHEPKPQPIHEPLPPEPIRPEPRRDPEPPAPPQSPPMYPF